MGLNFYSLATLEASQSQRLKKKPENIKKIRSNKPQTQTNDMHHALFPKASARHLVRLFPRGFAAEPKHPKPLVFRGTPMEREELLAEIYKPYFGHLARRSDERYRAAETSRAWWLYYAPFDNTVDLEWQQKNESTLQALDHWSSKVPFSLHRMKEGSQAALSHQSMQIEGSRLTLSDSLEIFHRIQEAKEQSADGLPPVEALVDSNQRLEQLRNDVVQLRNHIVAQEMAMGKFGDPSYPLFEEGDIKDLHATLLCELVPAPGSLDSRDATPQEIPVVIAPPGEYRLSVAQSHGCEMMVHPYSFEVPALMEGLMNWITTTLGQRELHPFLAACRFYATFLHIHPFADGNGPVGRLLFNVLALRFGYKPLYLQHLVREEYMDALFHATSHKQPDKWFSLAVENTVEALQLIVENKEAITPPPST